MGVIINGNIYVAGQYCGNASESPRIIKDGTFDANYEVPRKIKLGGND